MHTQRHHNPLAAFGFTEPATDADFDRVLDHLEAIHARQPSNTRVATAIRYVGDRLREHLAANLDLALAA